MKRVSTAKMKVSDLILRIVLIAYSIIVVFPLIWTIYTSFKTNSEFYDNPWSLPKHLNLINYVNAFQRAKMGDYFMNSIIITIVSIFFIVVLSVATAYIIVRFKSPYTKFLNAAYTGGLFVPSILTLIPLFLMLNNIHLLNTYTGLILVYIAYSLSFSIYTLIGFFKSIPKDYEEAALIDGCSYFGILFRIIFPLAKPAVITITIFNFLSLWNEYMFASIIMSSESKMTLPIGLENIMEVQRYATDWGALFAGLVIVMVPTMLVYALLQKKITGGLTVGGLKG